MYTSDAKDLGSRLSVEPIKVVDGIGVHYFRNLALMPVKKFKLFITPQFVSHAKEEVKKFDVIHLHEYRTFQNIVIAHYAKKYGVPYVMQARGSLPRIMAKQRLKWIYDVLFGYRLLRDTSKVIALSQIEAEQYRGMGVPDEKIAVIPNGIDPFEYANLPPKGCFKRKFNIPDDKKAILYLGRIHKTKGIDFLVKAYAHLTKNLKYDRAVLVIAGPDDGYLQEAKRLVASLGISQHIIFPGLLVGQEKIAAFVDASICAYLRPNEPFGNVSLEAAASGTPVVVCEGTPMSNIVKDGNFGFPVKYGDVTGLVNVFKNVLSNEGLKKEIGKRGHKYVFENFSWDKITDELENLYEQVITHTRR